MRVVEQALVPKAPDVACADQLILGHNTAGVADGTTAKSWDPAGPDGVALARAVAAALAELETEADAAGTVASATELVAGLLKRAGIAGGEGAAVSFCVLHVPRRQIWRVGEARVLVDGVSWPPAASGEGVVAAARALVLSERLAAGVPVDDLVDPDPGRAAIQGLLRSLVGLRNAADTRFGYGSIDGKPVPGRSVETLGLPSQTCEVVIATDGYPEVRRTLAESEQLLAERLRRDPLLIADPPETKGVSRDGNSFDDRAYLRVVLPAASS